MGAARAGDVSTVAAMAARAYRHSEAIGFDALQAPAGLLEAWAAARLGDGAAAVDAYGSALELASRAGLGTGRTRFQRARQQRPAPRRRAVPAGARRRRGGTGAVGRRPCARQPRPRPRRDRRRRDRRAAVPKRPRLVAGTA